MTISNMLNNSPVTSINVQTLTGAGTYTPTTGMKFINVKMVGGGGGSGGVSAAAGVAAAAAGGSGGSYLEFVMTAAQVGGSLAYSVGAAGAAGASTPGNGGAGGTTTFGNWTAGNGQGSALANALGLANGGISIGNTNGTGFLINSLRALGNPSSTYLAASSFFISIGAGSYTPFAGTNSGGSDYVIVSTGTARGNATTTNITLGFGFGGNGSGVYAGATASAITAGGRVGGIGTIVVTEYF
jgi:hypothetical protein